MKNNYTNIHFDYGGYYSEKHEWISNNSLSSLSFKTSSLEKITYSVLVEKICKKIAIDKTSKKLKLSYILCKSQRETSIEDDEDVLGFLMFLDNERLRLVLHVELVNDLEDQISRVEPKISVGVNYVELNSNGRDDDVENGGIRQMVRVRSQRLSECVGTRSSVSNDSYDTDICSVGSCSPISYDESDMPTSFPKWF